MRAIARTHLGLLLLVFGACQPLAGIETKTLAVDAGGDAAAAGAEAGTPECAAEERTCRDGRPQTCAAGRFAPSAACTAAARSCFQGSCTPARALALTASTTCVRMSDATARCWGGNRYGAVGDGSAKDRLAPTPVTDLRNVTELAAGGDHVCARTSTGTVMCWGQNDASQLGDPTVTVIYRPNAAPVPGLANVRALAAGDYHGCALTPDALMCWGGNNDGELGDGTGVDRPKPVPVKGLTFVPVEIAAAGTHTCARFADGAVACWGRNVEGQLGDGAGDGDRPLPSAVVLPGKATQLALGNAHSCARLEDGSVYCWGANVAGQLGNGTTTPSVRPVKVEGLSGPAVELTAGGSHNCARLASGGIMCWGRGDQGELGNDSINSSSRPVEVFGLIDAVEIDAGGLHTCAVKADGAVVCWGHNDEGQVGDGSTEQRRTPVVVLRL